MWRRAWRTGLILILALAVFAFFNNTNLLRAPGAGRPVLLAHRGLHQTFPADGLKADTCTAARIPPPEHGFLENTLPAMAAAFAAGADIVELDVHPTTDGHFAVLHDWTLDCRTDGKGLTRARTLAELKALDIGYGYTADGGKSYPFRGKGVGLVPSLDEVLAAFADKRLLIDIKSNEPADGEQLARRLEQLPPAQLARIVVYGGDSRAACCATSRSDGRGTCPRPAAAACCSCPSISRLGCGGGPVALWSASPPPAPRCLWPDRGLADSRGASMMR